jgi:hypothetical protein
MKYVTGPDLRPPPHIYGDEYERSLDPWHKDAFPRHVAHAAPDQSPQRKSGWMGMDHWGNPIIFVPDGTEVEVVPTQIRRMKPDMQDRLMKMGEETVIKHGLYEAAKGGKP